MDGIKRFLTVLCIAGCGGGGGGGGGGGPVDSGMPDGPPIDSAGYVDPNVPVAANDRCANAASINLAATHIDLPAVNPGGSHPDLDAPCGTAGSPDVFYKFLLTTRELVYADTFGSSSTTTLYFADSCTTAVTDSTTAGDAVCNSAACGTGQAQVAAVLNPGLHYLVLSGHGATTIHFQHAESGVGSLAVLQPGSSSTTGTTLSGTGALFACEAGGMEDAYWWLTCPSDQGGTLHATTCTGSAFDTLLSLQIPATGDMQCADDDNACAAQTRATMAASIPAGAGLHVLAVDGGSPAQHGSYTLTVSRP